MGTADLNEKIARRAYELYEQRGGKHGAEMEDWLQAEREIAQGNGNGGGAARKKSTKKAGTTRKKAATTKKKAVKKA